MVVIDIENHYLKQWPTIKELLEERPGTRAMAIRDMLDVVGLVVFEQGRIHHVTVNEEYRRSGYATFGINYVTRNFAGVCGSMLARVDPSNKLAMCTFIKCGYTFRGFDVSDPSSKRILMEYKGHINSLPEFRPGLNEQCGDVVRKIYVREVAAVKLAR